MVMAPVGLHGIRFQSSVKCARLSSLLILSERTDHTHVGLQHGVETMKKGMLAAVAAALMTLVAAPVADAQVGGLIRRAVREAAKAEEKPKTENSPFNDDVLEITQANLESVVRVATIEVRLQKEFKAELAKYPTAEEFRSCQQRAAASEDMQKLISLLDLPDNATDAQRQAAMTKYAESGAALVKKACPLDPNDWNDSKKQQRLAEIRKRALESAGSGSDAEAQHEALESGDASASAGSVWGTAALTQRQYEILLERIKRLCGLLEDAALADKGATAGIKVPGTSSTIFWVFTAEEVKVMTKANCQRIYDQVGQLI